MAKRTQRNRAAKKAHPPPSAAPATPATPAAAAPAAASARIVPFVPSTLVDVKSSKELILITGDVIEVYQKYHERTGLIHGNINPQTIMKVALPPDAPDRYGLRVQGVLLDLDYGPNHLFRPAKK